MSKSTKADAPIGLRWLGGDAPQRAIFGVPARDLDEHDLARLVFRRTPGKELGKPYAGLTPADDGFAAAQAKLVEELVASELYEPGSVPCPHLPPAPPAAPSDEAAPPAEAPAAPAADQEP